jgi:hypothetical protein
MTRKFAFSTALALVLASAQNVMAQNPPNDLIRFFLKRSATAVATGCLPNATATVSVKSFGEVEIMSVEAQGLPPNTGFDLFVIQLPSAPFGLSWYQGDMETDHDGRAQGTFIGRFSEETFIVAPGVGGAPMVHNTDATTNPATGPIHTAHLGLWFNSPADAAAAGCGGAVTPFNGEHNAGVQALSTAHIPANQGPLLRLK